MNSDAPAVMRRRRRAARQSREKTPEPIARMGGIKPKYSDEENSSTTIDQANRSGSSHRSINNDCASKPRTASNSSGDGSRGTNSNVAYRNKILSRRDRNMTAAVVRSHSTPRSVPSQAHVANHDDSTMIVERRNSSGNVLTFLRQVKRSLSIPRYVQRC